MRVGKLIVWVTVFSVFSTIQGKTMVRPFELELLKGYIIAAIFFSNYT